MFVHVADLFVFLSLLFSVNCDFGRITDAWEGNSDVRQAVGVMSARVQPLVSCAVTCSLLENCYALNYNEAAATCEVVGVPEGILQSPDAVAGWTHYLKKDFLQNPCSFPMCKPGSVCLPYPDRYEPDYYDEPPPSLWSRYTCSSHSYLIKKQQAGNPNCRFEQLPNTAVAGTDIPPYDPGNESYVTMLSYCDTVAGSPCLALESQKDGKQYLKTEHHLSDLSQNRTEFIGAAFFYADCYP